MRDFFFLLIGMAFLAVLIQIFLGFTKLHIDTQIGIYFTLVGIIFSWSFIEKSRKHFFGWIFPFWLVLGFVLFYKYLEGYYLILAIVGLPIGYGLYRLGVIDLLSYLDKTYSEKTKNISLRWLVIYYRCKLKKFEVYLNDGNNINQAIIINISHSSEFFTIYFFDVENKNLTREKEATLEFFDELVNEKLLIHPDMEILINGDANERTVFWLVNFLLKNRFDKVGFLIFGSVGNLLKSYKKNL